jgi:hypothetical protein
MAVKVNQPITADPSLSLDLQLAQTFVAKVQHHVTRGLLFIPTMCCLITFAICLFAIR